MVILKETVDDYHQIPFKFRVFEPFVHSTFTKRSTHHPSHHGHHHQSLHLPQIPSIILRRAHHHPLVFHIMNIIIIVVIISKIIPIIIVITLITSMINLIIPSIPHYRRQTLLISPFSVQSLCPLSFVIL